MKITRENLKSLYGIDLPIGLYKITPKNSVYQIDIIKDDTEGCVLVGYDRAPNRIGRSREAFNDLMAKIQAAGGRGKVIIKPTITIM